MDGQLSRWFENLSNGSRIYAEVSRRRLLAFVADSKTTLEGLSEVGADALRRLLEDYLVRERKRGHSGEYARTTLKAVRSWRVYHQKPFVAGLKVPNATLTPRVDRERMPTPEDLRRTLLAANPRERTCLAMMAFSGVRPQVLGNFTGDDGLRLSDFPEMKIGRKGVTFEKVPTLVRVRAVNSKTKRGYLTFLSKEGCDIVSQYLTERLIGGEKLEPDTDLVHPGWANKKFIRTVNIGDNLRRSMRAAGLDQRPYVWRAWFLSRLLEASNAGKVTDRYVEFWAGLTGDVTARHYTSGRAHLSESMIEDMRDSYHRSGPYLSTQVTEDDKEERNSAIKSGLLQAVGYSEEESNRLVREENVDIPKLVQEGLRRLSGSGVEQSVNPPRRAGEQRVVDAEATSNYLEIGWTFKSPLNGTKAVVEWIGSPP